MNASAVCVGHKYNGTIENCYNSGTVGGNCNSGVYADIITADK